MSGFASGGSSFRPALDALGRDIVEGRLSEGQSDTIDAIAERTGVSRTVAREATRVLVSLGMLSAGRRVGLRVLPREDWDSLDPQVIRWRLESRDRGMQLQEMQELRLAVEPEAARLAALRRTPAEADRLRLTAEQLAAAAEARDATGFLDADARFHRGLLAIARNGMLARLAAVIEEALRELTPADAIRWRAAPRDVDLHRQVANAIGGGDAAGAEEVMRNIVHGDRSG